MQIATPKSVLLTLLVALFLAAPASADEPSEQPELLVLAASSLTAPLHKIAERWEERHEANVKLSFGGSSKLAAQLTHGARADAYLSANRKWVEHLADKDLVRPDTRSIFASNRLVWAVPATAEHPPPNLDALRTSLPDRVALGGPEVPAGAYARRALRQADLWQAVSDRVVSAENVKRALQWIALGEVAGGIVYETDAVGTGLVDIAFRLPDRLQPVIAYEAAVPTAADHPEVGHSFVDFLTAPAARAVFEEAGFTRPSSTSPAPTGRADSGVDTASAIRLSLLVGLSCVFGGLLPAVLLGWLLARRSFRGKSLVATLLLAPLALPPVVTGFVLLRLFGASGLVGSLLASVGLQVPFTTLGAGLAAFVVSFPLYLLTARTAFEIVDRRYEEVSMTLGYRPRSTFWRVTVPLALPGLAAGALLSFARAMGEFGATAVLAGNVRGETQTIPLAIYTLLESPGGYDAIWLLVGISLGLSLLAVFGFEWFNRRQKQRLHR